MEQKIIERINELKQQLETLKAKHAVEISKHYEKREAPLLFFFAREVNAHKFAIKQLEMLLTSDVKTDDINL